MGNRRRLKQRHKLAEHASNEKRKAHQGVALSPAQQWLFRLGALVLIPLVLVAGLEGGLRLAGYGYPTEFFLHRQIGGKDMLVENRHFTARFFGRLLEQPPVPLAIPAVKPPGTVRIFLMGESAALGDPEPAMGMTRQLAVLLRDRYPGTQFEVVSPATVAINSHAIRCIAQDCARENADIWVLYMGNNEVVGPYGAGTIFGSRGLPMPLIRASIALKSTRIGELLDELLHRLGKASAEQGNWHGMSMFVGQQVRRDDPAMPAVYSHFKENLEDIIGLGIKSHAKVVVSTVVSNLKDCAPFASLHRRGLTVVEQADWEKFYQAGAAAEEAGKPAEAIGSFRKADALDDGYADLHFRWGRCCLALGQDEEGRRHFTLARESDALRFRADDGINDIIRKTASAREPEGVRLVDTREELSRQSPHGVPGAEFLYEHVHLNFEGNYRVARLLAEQVSQLLPDTVTHGGSVKNAWLPVEECARRLAWTESERQQVAVSLMLKIKDAPFTSQLNHAAQYQDLKAQMEEHLAVLRRPGALKAAAAECQLAADAAPDDWVLREKLGGVLQDIGEAGAALACWRQVSKLVPQYSSGYCHAGLLLTQQGHYDEAMGEFEKYLAIAPDDVWAMDEMGQTLSAAGKLDEAAQLYERVLKIKPSFGEAHSHYGLVLMKQGRRPEAEAHFRKAVEFKPKRPDALIDLGELCLKLGWVNEAVTNLSEAVEIVPVDALTRLRLGQVLVSLNRLEEARQQCAEAVRLYPEGEDTHVGLGVVLARLNHADEAVNQFREALKINPDNAEARQQLSRLQP